MIADGYNKISLTGQTQLLQKVPKFVNYDYNFRPVWMAISEISLRLMPKLNQSDLTVYFSFVPEVPYPIPREFAYRRTCNFLPPGYTWE